MRHKTVAVIESLSWRTCYACTGLRISWCGLAYWMGCKRCVLVLDVVFHRFERRPHHCRRSFNKWH